MTDSLELLRVPLHKLSNEALMAKLTDLRKDRMTSKHTETQRKKSSIKAEDKLASLLAGLSPEKIRELLS